MTFTVPQFIDIESKIIGPISARQFIEILVTLGLSYVWFELFPPALFIPAIMFTLTIGGVLAFAKVNSQLMHYFLLNIIQTLQRPSLRIWRRVEPFEIKITELKKEVAFEPVEKPELTDSRLSAISLMVDTGGAYIAEEMEQKANQQAQQQQAAIGAQGQYNGQPQGTGVEQQSPQANSQLGGQQQQGL